MADDQQQAGHDTRRADSEDRPCDGCRGARLARSAPDLAPAGSPGASDSVPASCFRPTKRTNIFQSSVMIGDLSALEFGLDGDNKVTYVGRSKTSSRTVRLGSVSASRTAGTSSKATEAPVI